MDRAQCKSWGPRNPPFTPPPPPPDSTHLLTLSEAWDLEQETNMARASEKWRTCVELQLYSDLTDCIERQHRGFNG